MLGFELSLESWCNRFVLFFGCDPTFEVPALVGLVIFIECFTGYTKSAPSSSERGIFGVTSASRGWLRLWPQKVGKRNQKSRYTLANR